MITAKSTMNSQTIQLLKELQPELERIARHECTRKVFVGFDGFVDTIMRAVKQKYNDGVVFYRTIGEFASRIQSAAGKSGQIELVTERVKFGGNAPILSHTLGKLGVHSVCAASLGYPERNPIFSDLDKKCETISLANPGDSRALEFDDGKIILSQLSAFNEYDWSFIKRTHGIENIRKAILDSTLVAFVDWVNLPHSSEIWEGVLQEIIKPSGRKDFVFLFDLCDPSKKTTEQIDEVLDLISCFSTYGSVTLGLNENETLKIWCAVNGKEASRSDEEMPDLLTAGDALYKTMNIDCLLIHPIDRTIVFRKHETLELKGRLVKRPKVLTGGGDNLNAGYSLALLNGLSIQHSMLLGMAASGAYVENGLSPDIQSVIRYITIWIEELEKQQVEPPAHVFTHRHE